MAKTKGQKTELEKRVDKEKNRIKRLLKQSGATEDRISLLDPVIINTAWMKVKLDDTMATIKESQVCLPYDNGGGQKGIRRNPLFDGYESLWKSYNAGMARITESLPPQNAESARKEVETAQPILQLIRDKKQKKA